MSNIYIPVSEVRRIRKKQGKNIIAFSLECGINKTRLTEIENGQAKPFENELIAIANALGVNIEAIWDGQQIIMKIPPVLFPPLRKREKNFLKILSQNNQKAKEKEPLETIKEITIPAIPEPVIVRINELPKKIREYFQSLYESLFKIFGHAEYSGSIDGVLQIAYDVGSAIKSILAKGAAQRTINNSILASYPLICRPFFPAAVIDNVTWTHKIMETYNKDLNSEAAIHIPIEVINNFELTKNVKLKSKAVLRRNQLLEDMHRIAGERGGKCLTTKCTDRRIAFRFKCKCGNIFEAGALSVKYNNAWCPICAKKHTTIKVDNNGQQDH